MNNAAFRKSASQNQGLRSRVFLETGVCQQTPTARNSERGAALLLFTFLCTFIVLPMVGLAVDGSIQYWMRSRLSSAVDSCALSTARALNVGQSLDEQMANATAIGQQYFNANFPAGMMGTSVVGGAPTITITKDARNTLIVNVQATASVPLYFMRVLGFNTSLVAASGQAQRRALNLILVLDRSGSMGPSGANVCGTMTAAAQGFVNNWVEGRDQVGLVTFQTSANVDVAPSYYFKSNISAALSSLQCAGATNATQGLYLAYQQVQQMNEPSAMNVIVFFTDGQPNAFQATYRIRTANDPRYYWTNETAGSTMVSIPPQPCNATDTMYGVVTTLFGGGSSFYVGGIYDSTPIAVSSTAGASLAPINAPGCYFYTDSTLDVPYDIQSIPSQLDPSGISTLGYKPLDLFTSGALQNQIRPDEYLNIRYAATNAADNIARTIRNDTNYNTTIYTVGLGGAPDMPIDADFLERLANDPRATSYDPSKASGQFVYASDAGGLAEAFSQIASQILRLAQ